ncbi:hypothetical protein Ahy_A03g012047 isoform C [Arachis hypogaea]|uniref:O-methyltransferase dimerisation domain-containing protein n=1 Tax=Arachis hypogaea TaxID=3818 RepID=A0A445DSF2_ARAHY|nr:hypothetical protein Ahy_A03g012047 isoform C [Arachis hypogaea]
MLSLLLPLVEVLDLLLYLRFEVLSSSFISAVIHLLGTAQLQVAASNVIVVAAFGGELVKRANKNLRKAAESEMQIGESSKILIDVVTFKQENFVESQHPELYDVVTRTALTYIHADGNRHRASNGTPEQVHAIIDKFAERGLRSLAVSRQEVPEKSKDSPGALCPFIYATSLHLHCCLYSIHPLNLPATTHMETPLESSANNHLKPKEEEKEEEDSLSLALEMLGLNVVPLAVNSTVELGVFDTIAKAGEGAMLSGKEIASQIESNNPEASHMLDRLLSHSLLRCSVSQQDHSHILYSLSPRSKYVVTDADDGSSLGPTLALLLDNVFYQSWKEVKGAIMEDGIPFNGGL